MKQVMKNVLLNWKQWLKDLFTQSTRPNNGGFPDNNFLNASAFFMAGALFFFENRVNGRSLNILYLSETIFISLFLLNFLNKKYYIDILSDILLAIALILMTPFGDLSACVFLIFTAFRIKNKNQYFIMLVIVILSLTITGWIQKINIFQTVTLLFGFSFVVAKYYIGIHIPYQKLKAENVVLKNRLDIIGDAKHLTDNQIMLKYDFMDLRKINSLRLLGTGKSRKEISGINRISDRQQDRLFDGLKKDIGKELDENIFTLQHLMIGAAKLDIIQVIIRHKEF